MEVSNLAKLVHLAFTSPNTEANELMVIISGDDCSW